MCFLSFPGAFLSQVRSCGRWCRKKVSVWAHASDDEGKEKGRRKREKERSSSFSETSFFVSFFFFVSLFLFSLRHSFIDHRLAPDRSAKFVLLRRAGQNRRAWFLSLLKQSVKLLFLLFSAPLEVLSFFFPAQFRTIAALSAASILVAAPTLAAF